MRTIHVQWVDADQTKILSVFGAPQDGDQYPNQDEVPSDDERYAAYYAALPPLIQSGLIEPGT